MDALRGPLLLVAAAALVVGAACAATLPMYEYDRSIRNRAGLKQSDVCLSVRFHQEKGAAALVRLWGATRLEWSYDADPVTVKSVIAMGVPFVGTLNTNAWDGPDQDAELFDGTRACAPWMVAFNNGRGVGWACVNKLPTLPRRMELLRKYADMGVNTIQHDDWRFNAHSYFWGACFCDRCMQEFPEFLRSYALQDDLRAAGRTDWSGFNYRQFLRERGITTTQHWLRERATQPLGTQFRLFQMMSSRRYFDQLLEGRQVNLTVNANPSPASLMANFLLDKLDYMVGETPIGDSRKLWQVVVNMKMADALNLPQVLSPFLDAEPVVVEARRAIALSYALGHRMLIPWDVYVPENKPRWFGRVEDYGDLYAFVRSSRELLDGYLPWSNVTVTAPVTSDLASTEKRRRDIVRYLMQAGYPCRLAAAGVTGEIVHVPADRADFAEAAVVVEMPSPTLAARDRDALRQAVSVLPVVDASNTSPRDICSAVARVAAPAYRIDSRNVAVLPRWKPDSTGLPRVVHLVNLGDPDRLSLWISGEFAGRASRVVVHRPLSEPEEIAAQPSSGGIRISDVPVDEWAVLAIHSR